MLELTHHRGSIKGHGCADTGNDRIIVRQGLSTVGQVRFLLAQVEAKLEGVQNADLVPAGNRRFLETTGAVEAGATG